MFQGERAGAKVRGSRKQSPGLSGGDLDPQVREVDRWERVPTSGAQVKGLFAQELLWNLEGSPNYPGHR